MRAAISLAVKNGCRKLDAIRLRRSILLKPFTSAGERGVLLVSFESELAKLAALESLERLEEQYALIFLPTWQPFYSDAILRFAARAHQPYWVMPSSSSDQALCSDLGSLCRPLPFQASSWVSSQFYAQNVSKTVDLLMLANFSGYKRHWRLFEAMRDMPAFLKVVLAGRPIGGRTVNSLLSEADAFGVRDRLEIWENPSDEEISTLLAGARVFCALSHKEGSYIAVAEALMAGTAVAMFQDAIVGSKEYLGPDTGWLLNPRQALGPQLLECLRHADRLRPAEWAKANISAEVNNVRLNRCLQEDASRCGALWTSDLAGFFCRHFEFEYFDASKEVDLAEEYRTLERRFGVNVARLDVSRSAG